MFTKIAHTSLASAKPWCGYSLPVASCAPFGRTFVDASVTERRLASESGEGAKRMSFVQPAIALGTNDRPPGALT